MKVSQTVVIVPNGTFQTFLPPHVEPAVKGQSNEIFDNSFFFFIKRSQTTCTTDGFDYDFAELKINFFC